MITVCEVHCTAPDWLLINVLFDVTNEHPFHHNQSISVLAMVPVLTYNYGLHNEELGVYTHVHPLVHPIALTCLLLA